MVRTAGIRISGGRSTKKVSGKITQSTPTSSGSKSGSISSRLPPIPHQETPSWQKPITNFFKLDSPLKAKENKSEEPPSNNFTDDPDAGPSKKRSKVDAKDTNGEGNNSEEEIEAIEEIEEVEENETEENKIEESEESGKEGSDEISDSDAGKENTEKNTVMFDKGAGSSKD